MDGFPDIFIADPLIGTIADDHDGPTPTKPGEIHIIYGGFASDGVDFDSSYDEVIKATDKDLGFGLDMKMADVIATYAGPELIVAAPSINGFGDGDDLGKIYIYSRIDGAWKVVQTLTDQIIELKCGDVTGDEKIDLVVNSLSTGDHNDTRDEYALKVYVGSDNGFSKDNVMVGPRFISGEPGWK